MPTTSLNDVFQEVNGFTTIQRLLGLSSLVYKRGKFYVSNYWFIINLFFISTVLSINMYMANKTRKRMFNVSSWYFKMSLAQLIFITNSIVVSWIQGIRNVACLNRCLLRLRTVDLQIFFLREELPSSRPSYVLMGVLALIGVSFCLRLFLLSTVFDYLSLLIMYLPFTLMVTIHMHIDRLAALLRERFQVIRRSLRRCTRTKAKKCASTAERLVLCYHLLCSSSENFNDYSSLQMLSILSAVFVTSFSEVYALMCVMYNNEPMFNNKETVIVKCIWSSITFSIMWQFSHQFSNIRSVVRLIL